MDVARDHAALVGHLLAGDVVRGGGGEAGYEGEAFGFVEG